MTHDDSPPLASGSSMTDQIRFDDGAAYERYMGVWSRLAGVSFLGWLAPVSGARWLDVGCGNGAFTELLVERCEPVSIDGVDPSEGQLAYARTRPSLRSAHFRAGDAMALPYADDAFDAAVMPLVIFFVPVPEKGIAEMARVVRAGGSVSAYAWDMHGGGFPYAALQQALRELGVVVPVPPSPGASRVDALRALWSEAGLVDVETTEITVQRTFADFGDYLATIMGGPSVAQQLAALPPGARAQMENHLREGVAAGGGGRVTYKARAPAG